MSDPEELAISIGGVNTRVLKGGAGPDLLYWHGAGGGGPWQRHHALLAEKFTVYAPDHPGWGASDSPEWMDTITDYVLHHDSLNRALGVKRPALVGHSLGGWMAAEYAATYPDSISHLVLINAAGYPFDDTDAVPDFFATVARGGPELAQMLFYSMAAAAAYFPAEPTPEYRLGVYHTLTSTARVAWHSWFEEKLPRRLARVSAPALLLWGAQERLFPVSLGQEYAASIPGSKLTILEECGHMMPIEKPEEMCAAILDHCSRGRG
jgi:pimeloyl-ACP methyl ester carboxylesterase